MKKYRKFAEGGATDGYIPDDDVIEKIQRSIDDRKSSRKSDAVKQGLRGAGKVAKQAALAVIPHAQMYMDPREIVAGANMTKEAFEEYMDASKKRKPSMQESKLVRQIPKGGPTAMPKPARLNSEENTDAYDMGMKHGGKVASASKRADGIAQRGKTRA